MPGAASALAWEVADDRRLAALVGACWRTVTVRPASQVAMKAHAATSVAEAIGGALWRPAERANAGRAAIRATPTRRSTEPAQRVLVDLRVLANESEHVSSLLSE